MGSLRERDRSMVIRSEIASLEDRGMIGRTRGFGMPVRVSV